MARSFTACLALLAFSAPSTIAQSPCTNPCSNAFAQCVNASPNSNPYNACRNALNADSFPSSNGCVPGCTDTPAMAALAPQAPPPSTSAPAPGSNANGQDPGLGGTDPVLSLLPSPNPYSDGGGIGDGPQTIQVVLSINVTDFRLPGQVRMIIREALAVGLGTSPNGIWVELTPWDLSESGGAWDRRRRLLHDADAAVGTDSSAIDTASGRRRLQVGTPQPEMLEAIIELMVPQHLTGSILADIAAGFSTPAAVDDFFADQISQQCMGQPASSARRRLSAPMVCAFGIVTNSIISSGIYQEAEPPSPPKAPPSPPARPPTPPAIPPYPPFWPSPPNPPRPPSAPPSAPPPSAPPLSCFNTCATANDNNCDDGRDIQDMPIEAAYPTCAAGTDCADCGIRAVCISCPDECAARSVSQSAGSCLEAMWNDGVCDPECNFPEW